MKSLSQIKLNPNLRCIEWGTDGGAVFWQPTKNTKSAVIIFSNGGGWDHVSISFKNRCPSWGEMGMVKDIFFNTDECVVQYHPAKNEYVNNHPYCLHLWKSQDAHMPTPPTIMVGIKDVE